MFRGAGPVRVRGGRPAPHDFPWPVHRILCREPHRMSGEEWDVLAREEVFAIRPYAVVSRERIRTGAGVVVDDFYEVALANNTGCVPQLASGDVLTLWQYKHGPRRFGLGFPAGSIDAGENPEAARRR